MSTGSANHAYCPNCGHQLEAAVENTGSKFADKTTFSAVQITSSKPLIFILSIFVLFTIGIVFITELESNHPNLSRVNAAFADTSRIDSPAVGNDRVHDTDKVIKADGLLGGEIELLLFYWTTIPGW